MRGYQFTFREFADSIDTTEYNFDRHYDFQYDIAYQKLNVINSMPPGQREYCGARSRGGAKTWEEVVFDLYLAQLRNPYMLIPNVLDKLRWEAPLRGFWYATSEDQLDQPKEYFDYIIDNSFLRFILKQRKSTLVRFKHGGKLKLSIMTKRKVRSGRADYITIDEEAQAEEGLYNAAIGILSQSLFGFISHISTPAIGTIFHKNYQKLERRQLTNNDIPLISKLPWWEVPFLARNKAFYEEEKRTKPLWWYLQEYCAEFTNPEGSVFKNVIYDPYPDWLLAAIEREPFCSGIDWNPAAGHCLGSVKWHPKLPIVVVTNEINLGSGYTHELKMQMFNKIAPWFCHGNKLVIEDGGINIGFVKWFKDMLSETRLNWAKQQWSREEWDNQDVAKMAACTSIYDYGITIYVDRNLYPETAKCIEECHWDPEATGNPKLAKDKANSPHFLDAFLHAISKKNRDDMYAEVTNFY